MNKQLNHRGTNACASHKPRRELLESTKLSKFQSSLKRELPSLDLPELSGISKLSKTAESTELNTSEISVTASTNGCQVCQNEILEADNELQQRTKVCRKCIEHYAQVDSAFNIAADEKTKAAKLALMAGRLKIDE